MKISPSLEISNKGWPDALTAFAMMLQRLYQALARAFNGNITFGNLSSLDNISGYWFSGTTPGSPGTDFSISHNLGRVPVGYLVFQKNAACDVYIGSVAATTTTLTLRATVGGVAVVIFVT